MLIVSPAALYLGSSLTMVSASPETPSSNASYLKSKVVVSPPAAQPASNPSLTELIEEEVRRDAIVSARSDDRAANSVEAGTMPDGDFDSSAAEVSMAVVATHDERIAYLKQQIALSPANQRNVAQIRFLRSRLRRAEAARHLAEIRFRAESPSDNPGSTVAFATSSRSIGFQPSVKKQGVSLQVADTGKVGTTKLNTPPASPHLAVTSHHVRRLLAAARHALEVGVTPTRPTRSAQVRLAGLMSWEGSETWSLADCPSRTA